MATIEFSTQSGRDPVRIIQLATDAIKITVGDLALAGQLIRSDIREKTAAGIDVEGLAFAPYSTKGPYYYNPSTGGGKFLQGDKAKAQRSAKTLQRALKKVGGGGQLSRTGRTIRFDSYAAFKAAFGRTTVDLHGVTPPHMLDAIVVRVDGHTTNATGSEFVAGNATVVVGIYGDEAHRASGHNNGARFLPRRHFFGISNNTFQKIGAAILDRIGTRARRALRGGS